jgi:capsular exopolysaccharide synthesis family protein
MDLREGWFVLRRRRLAVVATTLIVAALSVGYARQRPPVFEATAAVAFEPSPAPGSSPAGSVEMQASLARSPAVLEAVARRLGRIPASPSAEAAREAVDAVAARLRADPVAGTSIIEIAATADDARAARDLANAAAEAYRDHVAAARATRLRRLRTAIEHQVHEVEARARQAEEQAWAAPAIASRPEIDRLQRQVRASDDVLALLRARHLEVLLAESGGAEEVRLLRPATEPRGPLGGDTLPVVLLGGLLGLGLGAALAYVREARDASLGATEDVAADLGIPVLGLVPHIDDRASLRALVERRRDPGGVDRGTLRRHALLVTHFDARSPLAEAYRALRTAVQFVRAEWGGKVLLLTSAGAQAGTTTTAVNLALTMAQNGQRTLLVGADLRRPSVHAFFGLDREPGLTDVLLDQARWRDCVRTMTDILTGPFETGDIMAVPGLDNLNIVACGPLPPDPGQLLAQPAMARFLREVRDGYDVVLVDTPPALAFADAAIVGAHADGVLLVHRPGTRGRLGLRRARARLEQARAQVWGVVLNDVAAGATASGNGHVGDEELLVARAAPAPAWSRATVAGLLALALIGAAAGAFVWIGTDRAERATAPAAVPAGQTPTTAPAEPPSGAASLPARPTAPGTPAEPARASTPPFVYELPGDASGRAVLDGPAGGAAPASAVEGSPRGVAPGTVPPDPGPARYAVLVEGVASEPPDVLAGRLREDGFAEVSDSGGPSPGRVRVGGSYGLRVAVEVAERLQARGHRVRVARLR